MENQKIIVIPFPIQQKSYSSLIGSAGNHETHWSIVYRAFSATERNGVSRNIDTRISMENVRRVLETKIPLHADLMETPIGIDIFCVNRDTKRKQRQKDEEEERQKWRNTTVTNDNISLSFFIFFFVVVLDLLISHRISVVSSHPVASRPKYSQATDKPALTSRQVDSKNNRRRVKIAKGGKQDRTKFLEV